MSYYLQSLCLTTFNSCCHAKHALYCEPRTGEGEAFIAAGFVTDAVLNKHTVPCVPILNAHKSIQHSERYYLQFLLLFVLFPQEESFLSELLNTSIRIVRDYAAQIKTRHSFHGQQKCAIQSFIYLFNFHFSVLFTAKKRQKKSWIQGAFCLQ